MANKKSFQNNFAISILLVLLVMNIFSSCLSVYENTSQRITIIKDKHILNITTDQKIHWDKKNTEGSFTVVKSKDPIALIIHTDTTEEYIIYPKMAFRHYFNYMYSHLMMPMMDRESDRIYRYPSHIYLSLKNGELQTMYYLAKKGTWRWELGIPLINHYYLQQNNVARFKTGIWGFETDIDYFYKDKRYISFTLGKATNYFIIPFVNAEYNEQHTSPLEVRYVYASFRKNYCIQRFDLGYGINFSNLDYPGKYNDTTFAGYQKLGFGLGLSISAGYAEGNYYHIGILYQPTFINFNNRQQIDYQHLLSFELLWRIPVVKGKFE